MAKKEKFTFKKQPRETGLAAVGNPNPNTDIKHDKKIVGYIASPNWQTPDNQWRIRLMVEDVGDLEVGDGLRMPSSGWKWITLKKTFNTEPEARDFLNKHVDAILAKGLYHDDEE